jgi:alkylation response protein AidB-like acyl-CoA dehydrogenase
MDLNFGASYQQFFDQVQAFLKEYWPPSKTATRGEKAAAITRLREAAIERGYLYRNVPRCFGGSEQQPDVIKAEIIRRCFAKVRAPMEIPGNGVGLLVPTLLDCGADWQKEKFIAPTLRGEFRWAQGYSEPGAGSDLASVRSKAELVDGRWVINGHKIWTTLAHESTHMFALLRTEPDATKHDGISYILLEMNQPGVTVHRIRQISGQSEFCEVFLDGASAPADWIVGERGKGWQVSKSTLKHERNMVGGASRSQGLLDSLVRLAKTTIRNGRPAIQDPVIRSRLVAIDGTVKSHTYSSYHQLTKDAAGESSGILQNLNKLTGTEIGKAVASVAADILGDRGLIMPPAEGGAAANRPEQWLNQVFGSLALSIAGGASNIQRNIIAERGLGLPRDPSTSGAEA